MLNLTNGQFLSCVSFWSQLTLYVGFYHQVTCVINNFQQLQPGLPPPRPQRPESMLGMPMVTLPSVESPLEKLSGPQVRGGGGCEAQLCSQKGWDTHPLSLNWIRDLPFVPQKRTNSNMHAPSPPARPVLAKHPSESFKSLRTRGLLYPDKNACEICSSGVKWATVMFQSEDGTNSSVNVCFGKRCCLLLKIPQCYKFSRYLVYRESHLCLWGESAVWLTHSKCYLPFGYNAEHLAEGKLWSQQRLKENSLSCGSDPLKLYLLSESAAFSKAILSGVKHLEKYRASSVVSHCL